MAQRKKYDFHLILSYYDLTKEFSAYQKKHNTISFNRAARSFLMKKKVNYKKDCFVVGSKEDPDCYFMRIAKAKWIVD